MSSVDYREKLRAMAQEERERMNDFILSEARRKEQKDLEPEPVPETTPAPVVTHEPKPEPVAVVVEPPKPKPEPVPEPTPAPVVVHEPEPEPVAVEAPKPAPEPNPESEPKNKENIKKSFNFLADGDVREWLLYKRECGYNTSSLIKRVLREFMAHDMEWLSHVGKQG